MNLSNIFPAVMHKRLAKGELPHLGSNQHELNGTAALKKFLGVTKRVSGKLSWHYFADDREPAHHVGNFTFYDAREKSVDRTGRSEWRFYYYDDFLAHANEGDWIFIARTNAGDLFALCFQDGSSWLRAAKVLFGVESSDTSFDFLPNEKLTSQQLELARRQILDELELDVAVPAARADEQIMLEKFGGKFPTTAEMSQFARSQIDVDIKLPDSALLRWLDREEQLFRAMESVIIKQRLGQGFREVDDFISYSLSVQNRRKSRMGFALQNHLAELFKKHSVRFTAQCQTEGKSRPDFIFPGYKEYHDRRFSQSLLVMLGAKSSCKERWRQVLVEAAKISQKHLCTLDHGISVSQTDEMAKHRLTLVVPDSLHATYTDGQRSRMLNIQGFIQLVQHNQKSQARSAN